MALQTTGAISIDNIRTELGQAQANSSLRALSALASKSSPDAMSDFYGFSAATEYQFYQGDDGGFGGWEAACSDSTSPLTLYSSSVSLAVDVYLYNDTALTSAFDGGELWYKYGASAYQIKNGGKIMAVHGC